MKLAHYDLESVFSISPGRVNVLVVEDELQFFRYGTELIGQIAGADGNFCLSEEDETLPLSKAGAIIHDFFSWQGNERKSSAKLYRMLQEIAGQHCLTEYQELCAAFASFFAKLNSISDCPLDYEEDCGMEGLFKAFGVCLEAGETILEKLLFFIRAQRVFARTRCFFFIGLKTVLSERQLAQFYHEAELMEVPLFLLENVQKPCLESEIVTVIDRDLCEFVVK